jgi:hypothetical protein
MCFTHNGVIFSINNFVTDAVGSESPDHGNLGFALDSSLGNVVVCKMLLRGLESFPHRARSILITSLVQLCHCFSHRHSTTEPTLVRGTPLDYYDYDSIDTFSKIIQKNVQ